MHTNLCIEFTALTSLFVTFLENMAYLQLRTEAEHRLLEFWTFSPRETITRSIPPSTPNHMDGEISIVFRQLRLLLWKDAMVVRPFMFHLAQLTCKPRFTHMRCRKCSNPGMVPTLHCNRTVCVLLRVSIQSSRPKCITNAERFAWTISYGTKWPCDPVAVWLQKRCRHFFSAMQCDLSVIRCRQASLHWRCICDVVNIVLTQCHCNAGKCNWNIASPVPHVAPSSMCY